MHDNDEKKEAPETKGGMDRRQFLKLGTAGAAVGAVALATPAKQAEAGTLKEMVSTTHDEFPLRILPNYKRFDQRNNIFNRAGREPWLGKYAQGFDNPVIQPDKPGWTQLDHALERAAWSVHDSYSPGSAGGVPNTPAFAWEGPTAKNRYEFASPEEAAEKVKRAARFLGASLVGITPYDERWVYDPIFDPVHNRTISSKEFPFQPKSVIVMALEMDYDCFTTAPSWIESAGAGKQYSRMAFVGSSMATFLRQLGYHSFGAGNDIALSIPYAIAAGLGELGRNGCLVTFEYGPRVRICKVFTELEMAYDKPRTFGVKAFCKACKRCAESCPSGAISFDDEPTFEPLNISNNAGVEKWPMDAEKCFKMWGENGGDCGTCIASCVYSKPELWHHRMMSAASSLPGGSIHKFMTSMDKAFGYGNTYDERAILDWWKD